MGIAFGIPALIARGGQQYAMSSLLTSTAADAPQYLVLVGLDRDRYTAASTGERGSLSGNGHTATFNGQSFADSYSLGIVFSYTAKGYYNSTYGYLADLTFKSSADQNRNEYLSLFGYGTAGTDNPALLAKLQAAIDSPYYNGSAFMVAGSDISGQHLGTLDIVTNASYVDATPGNATPAEVAAIAMGFIGQTWNDNGCWVLASNIATMAGASLPLTSDTTHPATTPPVANGAWVVAYDSAKASSTDKASWESNLRPGDIVVVNNSCGGHILTVASGTSYSALFIDNSGTAAPDGAAHDIVIMGPHNMPSWALGPDLDNIVIYRLDAPVIQVTAPMLLKAGDAAAVAPLLSTSDPAGKAITSYQVYTTGSGLLQNGATMIDAHTAAAAALINASAMATMRYQAGAANGSDSITLRAFNGSYWGDWQTLPVSVATSVQAPVLNAPATTVTIHGGQSVALSSLFTAKATDPVTTYTITSPAFGGTVLLNGAVNLLGTGDGAIYGDQRYTVSAADLAKVTYVAPVNIGGEDIVITAQNAASLSSMPLTLTMSTVAPTTQAVAHYITVGSDVPISALFGVTLADNVPLSSYQLSDNVTIIDYGPNTPSQGTSININGARDLLANSGVPAGFWQVVAADIGKVTVHAASTAGIHFIDVRGSDGAGGSPAIIALNTTTDKSPLTAKPATVAVGESVAASTLFSSTAATSGTGAPLYYRFTDPTGGGSLELDKAATNLQSKSDNTPGIYILQAEDLAKLSYRGGSTGGSEWLTVTVSNDMHSWSAEAFIQVTTTLPTTLLSGGPGNDTLQLGRTGNNHVDGGAGVDTVVVPGTRSQYTLAANSASSLTLTDSGGVHGVSTLDNIERLRFDDMGLAFDVTGNAGQLYRLYLTVLGRAPDAGGFGWWLADMDRGTSAQQVAYAFSHSDEFVRTNGASLSDAGFVNLMYTNAMHTVPTPEATAHLLDALARGYAREVMMTDFASTGQYVVPLVAAITTGIPYLY